jgi:hypothetical protein
LFGKISEIKTPDPHLIDPMTALRRMKIANIRCRCLLKKRKSCAVGRAPNQIAENSVNSDIEVY